jgi:hypothetical protein
MNFLQPRPRLSRFHRRVELVFVSLAGAGGAVGDGHGGGGEGLDLGGLTGEGGGEMGEMAEVEGEGLGMVACELEG